MSYFHTGTRTIIGAEAFHCPVRDGKEWDHLAMVIRLNRSPSCSLSRHPIRRAAESRLRSVNQIFDCAFKTTLKNDITCSTHFDTLANRQSYRVKPHEQLVLVSL